MLAFPGQYLCSTTPATSIFFPTILEKSDPATAVKIEGDGVHTVTAPSGNSLK